MAEALTIPRIDGAALFAGDEATVAALRAAGQRHGFFYLVNHGIDPALIAAVFAEAQGFFALPMAEKAALDMAGSPCNRGYEPLRGQRLEAGSPPDLKEGFYIGEDLAADDPRVLAGRFNMGANQW
ncbi:MAG TPA: 2-oxoglutarate and iron-dependent oxygenase domain-containing protein, partial [Novosphingobium sp.]|nr:2-oxoglutarate and iron-dependent oxygenase domain-containing protein [Novosphingobium sp.]